ncbi:shikimate dehydrogenase [candidate division KSB1 bacterium]
MEEKRYHFSKFCGLFGYPIKHTLSPLMHNISFDYHEMDWVYLPFETKPKDLEKAVIGLKSIGVTGFNITMPFKEDIIKLLDEVDDEVEKMSAVNTVKNANGKLIGYNTDHRGFFRTFENYKDDVKGESVIMFGAGGAAKAVLYSLLYRFEPEDILVLDVLEDKIDKMNAIIDSWCINKRVSFNIINRVSNFNEKIRNAKLIINASPVGMTPDVEKSVIEDENILHENHIVYDLVYNPIKTAILKMAEKRGAIAIGGLDMLIYQGAEAFKIWTGKDMPVDIVREKTKLLLLKAV